MSTTFSIIAGVRSACIFLLDLILIIELDRHVPYLKTTRAKFKKSSTYNFHDQFIITVPQNVEKSNLASFRRKPESSLFNVFWMPDQVSMTSLALFTNLSIMGTFHCFQLILNDAIGF